MTSRSTLLFGFVIVSHLLCGQGNNTIKVRKIDSLLQQLVTDKKTAGFAFGIQIGNTEPITKEYGFTDYLC